MLVSLRAVGRWVAAFNNQATLFASVFVESNIR